MKDGIGEGKAQHESFLELMVSGRVQGVGYRAFAVKAAAQLGARCTAVNLADGRVHVNAWGSPEALRNLRAQLQTGPRFARVERIELLSGAAH